MEAQAKKEGSGPIDEDMMPRRKPRKNEAYVLVYSSGKEIIAWDKEELMRRALDAPTSWGRHKKIYIKRMYESYGSEAESAFTEQAIKLSKIKDFVKKIIKNPVKAAIAAVLIRKILKKHK